MTKKYIIARAKLAVKILSFFDPLAKEVLKFFKESEELENKIKPFIYDIQRHTIKK